MKIKIIKYSIVFLLIASIVIFVTVQVLGHKTVYIERAPYDKTGFIAKEDYNEEFIEIENSKYALTLNTTDTNFTLLDKTTGEEWSSTPQHDTLLVPADARELFLIFYERKVEASKRVSVNIESIQYGNFDFRVKDNTIEVLYRVGGKHNITLTDLPRQISNEKFQTLIIEPLEEKAKDNSTIRRQLSFLKAQFNYVQSEDRHYLKTLTSQDSIDIVYNLIFNESLYTYEDYLEDALTYGVDVSTEIPYFEFSVIYELNDVGFNVKLVNDSIIESEKFPIAYIDVLPFFGAGNIEDEGFTVVPDGSGIYIDHNNLKYNTVGYEKRIYGNDLSVGIAHEIRPAISEKLSFPMYGYNKNGYGFINVILEGDTMSTLRAGFLTESNSNVYTHKIPYAHYRFALRERDAFIFQSSTNQQRVTSWTVPYNTEDFVMSYQFIKKSDSTYFDMVKQYQAHLVETYLLEKITQRERLHLTLLGGYVEKNYFLGFPYQSVESLTSVDGVRNIRDSIQNLGIDQFSITYQGFSNQGIKSTTYKKTNYNGNIGTKRQIEKLIKEFKADDIDLFLEFATLYAHTDKNLNIDKDITQNIFHKPVYRYPYSPATLLADKSKTISYIHNTSATNKVMTNILKTTNMLDTKLITFTDFGTQIASNLNKKHTQLRNEVVKAQQAMLDRFEDQTLQLRNPNLYALVYADQILDLDMVGTIHSIVDYDIPFVPLVLNGYFNYAGPSINIEDSKSVNWHMLKAIETGSNIQFTFTNDQTTKLIKTEYNYLISTYYDFWLNDVKRVYDTMVGLDIFDRQIIDHRILNPQGSLVEVTYEGNLKIQINYELESYMVIS